MTRHALLFGSGGNAPFVLEAFEQFLLNGLGGAWKPDEVTRFDRGAISQVLAAVQRLASIDYALVVYCGPAELMRVGRPWAEVRVTLNDGGALIERDVNPGSTRCLQLFDCTGLVANSPIQPAPDADAFGASRGLFDSAVEAAETGIVRVHNCSAQSVPPPGDSLILQLIRASTLWAQVHRGTLGIDEAIERASKGSLGSGTSAAAGYNGARRHGHYPFAVAPFLV